MLKSAGARTFGEMGSSYFDRITAPLGKNNCVRVDVVFDRYDKADSIKEGERVRSLVQTLLSKRIGNHLSVTQ